MIAIIAEKPSVGRDIARVVGATEKHNGYMEGGGYIVTWAFGHLVGLAPPEAYEHAHPSPQNLPVLPDPFRLVVRQCMGKRGTATDPAAAKQIKVIGGVFSRCESIIVATDAGREGELIFRLIYAHLGCTLPFRRLWISSLTDEAILKGMSELKEGGEYDNLHLAADCRAKADWLIGMNASRALAARSGSANNSLGRVQTPTLALVCSRWLENRGFLPFDYWVLSATLGKGDALRETLPAHDAPLAASGEDSLRCRVRDRPRSVDEPHDSVVRFHYVEEIKDRATADAIEARLRSCSEATVTKVERKTTHEAPPLLYDLTALQKDCNTCYGMSAEQTLNAAQSLYEKKFISYPRTGSRYLPPDMERYIPSLLKMILRMESCARLTGTINPLRATRRSIDASKVTDHHALIITGNYIRETITENERRVYDLICGRMLEAFGPRCEKETLLFEAAIGDLLFRSRSVKTLSAGWRAVWNHPEEPSEGGYETCSPGIEFTEGEKLSVMGHGITARKTRPKPLYTEATLLAAMEMPCKRGQSEQNSAMPGAAGIAGTETAGRYLSDEQAHEAVMECALGTPATRAAIIETLIGRDYIERSGRSLIPTETGLCIYKAVRDMRIADPALTGEWEKALAGIERGDMAPESFLEAIKIYTKQITKEILSLTFPQTGAGYLPCPKCGNGRIIVRHKVAKCDSEECGLVVFRRFLNKELTDTHLKQLITSGTTNLIKGFKGKKEKTFDTRLAFDKNFNLVFAPPPENRKGPKTSGKQTKTRGTKGSKASQPDQKRYPKTAKK